MIRAMGNRQRSPALLDEDHAAFIQGGVSVIVATRNAELVADAVRGCGCRVSKDRRQRHGTPRSRPDGLVIADIESNGMIAVVFSQPSTHRTIQLKGTDARVVRISPGDRALAARHLAAWVADLCSVGYQPEFATHAPRRGSTCHGRGRVHADVRVPADARPRRRRTAAGLIMAPTLHSIRPALEGAVPAVIATCARDGTPNVSYISEVHYVDPQHVALSFQFFSKTRQNVLENPRATVVVVHPETGAQYRLAVRYLRTEDSGPLFECMKAKLAGIASHSGMTGVFRLRGSDVYRVDAISEVEATAVVRPRPRSITSRPLRAAVTRMAGAPDLATLFDTLLDCLRDGSASSTRWC